MEGLALPDIFSDDSNVSSVNQGVGSNKWFQPQTARQAGNLWGSSLMSQTRKTPLQQRPQYHTPTPQQTKYAPIPKADLPSAILYCDACDREFKSTSEKASHFAQHEKCTVSGCAYVAAPKLVQLHYKMQHKTGLAKHVWATDCQDWIEARKRNYPTAQNIAKKRQEEDERRKRGEVVETRDFGKFRGRGGRGGDRRGRGRGRGHRQHGDDTYQSFSPGAHCREEQRRPIVPPRVQQTGDPLSFGVDATAVPDKDEDSPPSVRSTEGSAGVSGSVNTGAGALSKGETPAPLSLMALGVYGGDSSEEEGEIKESSSTLTPSCTTIAPVSNSDLHSPPGSADWNNNPPVNQHSKGQDWPAPPRENRHRHESWCQSLRGRGRGRGGRGRGGRRGGRCNCPGSRDMDRCASGGAGEGSQAGSEPKRRKYDWKDWKRPQKSSLLEKLLAKNIRKERNVIYQCVKHAIRSAFYGILEEQSTVQKKASSANMDEDIW